MKRVRSASLDRKMDRMLKLENEGKLKTEIGNRGLRKFKSNKLAVFGLITFAIICILCYLAPVFTSYKATDIDLKQILIAPNSEHIVGTDQLGRDLWARILYGGRISIAIGLGSAVGSAIIGVSLGLIAGFNGGFFDKFVLKISEIFSSVPQLMLVLIMVAITSPSLLNILFIFVLTGWTGMYRMARARVLSIKEEEYIQSLKAFGIKKSIIEFKHILPNIVGPIFVNITLSTSTFILQEASLSFLDLGVPQEIATWGNILNVVNGRLDYIVNNWWLWLPCGIFLTLFVLSINFIGDGLRDATDPNEEG